MLKLIALHAIRTSQINAKSIERWGNQKGSANARCHRSGISQGLIASGAMLVIKQEINMQMPHDRITANRMPSRVSEIRVRSRLLGVSSKGVLSVGEAKCETKCCVVVNQVGDVYRALDQRDSLCVCWP